MGIVEFWGLPSLIPLLQYVIRLCFETCSVDSCQSEKLGNINLNWQDALHRSQRVWHYQMEVSVESKTLYILDYVKIVSL